MKYSSEHFQFDAKVEWEILDDYLKRKVLGFNDDLMMVKIHFKKGGVGAKRINKGEGNGCKIFTRC